jgi:hypothetical protein
LNASKRGSGHGYHNAVDHGRKMHLGGAVHRVGVDLVRSSEVLQVPVGLSTLLVPPVCLIRLI